MIVGQSAFDFVSNGFQFENNRIREPPLSLKIKPINSWQSVASLKSFLIKVTFNQRAFFKAKFILVLDYLDYLDYIGLVNQPKKDHPLKRHFNSLFFQIIVFPSPTRFLPRCNLVELFGEPVTFRIGTSRRLLAVQVRTLLIVVRVWMATELRSAIFRSTSTAASVAGVRIRTISLLVWTATVRAAASIFVERNFVRHHSMSGRLFGSHTRTLYCRFEEFVERQPVHGHQSLASDRKKMATQPENASSKRIPCPRC